MSDQVLWGVSNDIHVATLLIACGGFGGGGGGWGVGRDNVLDNTLLMILLS